MMKCKHYQKAPFPGKHEQCFAYLIMEEEVVVYFLYAVQKKTMLSLQKWPTICHPNVPQQHFHLGFILNITASESGPSSVLSC